MKDFRHLVMAMLAAFALSGCVIVISDEGFSTADGVHMKNDSRDRALAGRVSDAYAADPALKELDISVAARDGTVTLRGELSRVPDLERAIDLAKRTEGVDKVISKLRVEVR